MWRKLALRIERSSPTRDFLWKPTFPTFSYKTWFAWETKKFAWLEGWPSHTSRVALFPWKGHPLSRANFSPYKLLKHFGLLRACLHGGGGPEIGEVTCGGSTHLSCKRDQIKMRDYMERRVTPPKWVTSPSWGPPPPCKQALSRVNPVKARQS